MGGEFKSIDKGQHFLIFLAFIIRTVFYRMFIEAKYFQNSVKPLNDTKHSQVKTINFTGKKGYATGFAISHWSG